MQKISGIIILLLSCTLSFAQGTKQGPRVLIVTAHPDDETAMAATTYKVTHDLKGTANLCVITNGEAGYKYSTLAEPIDKKELTIPEVGRKYLPAIRKKELKAACKVIGISKIFFLLELDSKYGLDERDPLDTSWNVNRVKKKLNEILADGNYDFVFCLLPVPGTHGGHKAASLLALRSVMSLNNDHKPIILGVTGSSATDTAKVEFKQLKDYTETKIMENVSPFVFDKTVKFGYKDKLDYRVIVNWEIAEHKSQGTMQLAMNQGDFENYWYFEINGVGGIDKAKKFFEALKQLNFEKRVY
nr:PIG-L family deacetylase [Bacteroidota bacterium]